MKIKAFQRLNWKSDGINYFNVKYFNMRSIVVHFGPIVLWLHR